jgi:hypothetical protein
LWTTAAAHAYAHANWHPRKSDANRNSYSNPNAHRNSSSDAYTSSCDPNRHTVTGTNAERLRLELRCPVANSC